MTMQEENKEELDELEQAYDRLNERSHLWTIADFAYTMVHRYEDKDGNIPKELVANLVSDVAHSFSFSLHQTLNSLGIANYGELKKLAKQYKENKNVV